ncbi:MAG: hypothetical protein IPI59_05565 [Sphingobacteriales bacterium]|nr:hypothetical protein [Sphingobacteriales bacterium]MDA0200025.1 hypothetical protein [Bacteroidota bacterium]MBK6891157.1 hypothetical protein [Sphingobacteriales bacterium]MBK7527017.1 hypothetical protein [Sphingobacteriales bacterium]MBK8677507.1 hypothetical protein [Sphingobacteriales bacterium]
MRLFDNFKNTSLGFEGKTNKLFTGKVAACTNPDVVEGWVGLVGLSSAFASVCVAGRGITSAIPDTIKRRLELISKQR